MRRVLFLGNSHLAALREAWRTAAAGRWPFEAHFVGAHRDLLLQTEVTGGRLRPVTTPAREAFRRLGGVTEVALGEYDAVVVAGCMVAMPQAAAVYRDARWPGLPSLAGETDIATLEPRLLSRSAVLATLAANLGERLGPKLAARLRTGTDAPILLASQPRLAARAKGTPRPTTRSYLLALRNGDAASLSALFDEAAAIAAAQAGAGFLPQARATIDDHIFTAERFVEGATRLTQQGGAPQPKDDILHANAAYGATVLDQVAAALDT